MMPENPGVIAWAHIFLQFGQVVAPLASGPTTRVGGHHVAYERDLLLSYGDNLESLMADESVLHRHLVPSGVEIYATGETVSGHAQISDLKNLMKLEFIGQRSYAATRVVVMEWSWFLRLAYTCGAPLIPFVRCARSLQHVFRAGRGKQLLPLIIPPMFIAALAGAAGEATGYLFGAGKDTLIQRLDIELDRFSYVNQTDQDIGYAKRNAPSDVSNT